MKIKNVNLKNFNLADIRAFTPYKEGVEVKWYQDEKDQTFASIVGSKKEINNQLQIMSKNIESERVRTLNNLPKYRIINSQKIRIY